MSVNGVTTLGNRTFLYGGASGIDTSALITAAYNQRKSEADKIDAQVAKNTSKYNAYEQLQTLGQNVQTALANIKKNYSVLATSNGLFDQRTGSLSSSSTTNLMTVTIDPGTDLGSYEIEVINKAKAQKVGSDATYTDKTADLGYTGSFDIALEGHSASTINVTSGMSLEELATAINSASSTTGVKASVIQGTSSTYQLVMTAVDTAKEISVSNVTGTDVLQSIGMTSGGSTFVNELQGAEEAEIKVDGVSYKRDTNDFSDVITGVHITVKNSEPGTLVELDVENDNSGVKDGITAFIDAYNALRDFIKTQQTVSSTGEVDDSAVLFGDPLLKSITSSVQALVGQSYGAGGTDLSSLAELGITLDQDNKLVMDESIFDTALLDHFDEVSAMFTTKVTTDNTSMRMMGNTSTRGSASFTMDVTYSGGAITGVSVGGDSSLFTITGQSIVGKAGTIYEGMSFAYVGTSSASVNIDIQEGFGDSMDKTADSFADVLTGTLHTQMLDISDLNTTLEARSETVLQRADEFRNNLIDKYANLEAKMAAAQSVLAQLQSLLGTNNNNNN